MFRVTARKKKRDRRRKCIYEIVFNYTTHIQ
ncbi:unnamed protein product [Acanthoscelides obtectus]|uniref:Uncharacterized protein n=1 Tax=Acanthoscelides obtectus TaxID=200917 RepID=A0A9P0JYZ3_ACAOB|nr:unnamed protein product [Acanthoscelides obtectus]CAK1637465.1 hypothetical protein AOBTE_LOCUS9985 [Acanthoscelides obtectus]